VQWLTHVIPASPEVKIGTIAVQDQHGSKVSKTPSHPISEAWWYMPVIPPTQKHK
jgi:hypothetical protein